MRDEIFSRCAKSLVLAGPPNQTQADRRLGFTLELVAERNPYASARGGASGALDVQDRPMAGALVVAMNRLNPARSSPPAPTPMAGCDSACAQGGMWLVKAVHMFPAPAGSKADWASFWASLTFALPEMAATGN